MPYNERVRELKERGYNGVGIRKILKQEKEANYKQQLQEVEALYQQKRAQGMTQAQAATSQGFAPTARPGLPRPQQNNYVFSDGDTLDSVASQFGTTANDLLDANPAMSAPQVGMVINTAPPKNTLPTSTPNWQGAPVAMYGTHTLPKKYNQLQWAAADLDDLFTWAGLYGTSGRQWWERKGP